MPCKRAFKRNSVKNMIRNVQSSINPDDSVMMDCLPEKKKAFNYAFNSLQNPDQSPKITNMP